MPIYLDTNVLPARPHLDRLDLAALQAVAQEHGEDLVLPALVVEEAVHRVMDAAQQAVANTRAALEKLRPFLPKPPIELDEGVPERAADAMRETLTSTFRIADAPPDAAHEALIREVRRDRPAREGRGARDAAIWLTIRHDHQQSQRPGYFLTLNTKDFSDEKVPETLHPQLQAEIASAPPLNYFTTMTDLLSALAAQTELSKAQQEVLINSDAARAAVIGRVQTGAFFDDLPVSRDDRVIGTIYAAAPVTATPLGINSIVSWNIADATISAAWVLWRLDFPAGLLRRYAGGGVAPDRFRVRVEAEFQMWLRQHPTDETTAQVLLDRHVSASLLDPPDPVITDLLPQPIVTGGHRSRVIASTVGG